MDHEQLSNWLPGFGGNKPLGQDKPRPALKLGPLIDQVSIVPSQRKASSDLHQILTSTVPSPEYPLTRVYGVLLDSLVLEFKGRTELFDQLNRTRRESLNQYLGFLGPDRELAIQTFWKEISFVWLMKATLLKRWSDLGLKPWSIADLKDLNFTLSKTLRPLLPTDRKECLLTQSSFYSWLKPSSEFQTQAFETLSGIRFTDESFDAWISATLRLLGRVESYDPHCLKSLLQSLPIKGDIKQVFTPTLRTGELLRTFSGNPQWIGLEQDHLLILIAETSKLWSRPESPPLWDIGSGVDWLKHPNQLGLRLGAPLLQTKDKILEIESFDLSIVIEESLVRANGKLMPSIRLKQELENGAFSKLFRGTNISQGTLQALLSISKLRPGGHLVWLRSERLGEHEPKQALKELLSGSILIRELDLSQMNIEIHSEAPALPQFLYLFKREINNDLRRAHRPERVQAKGALRSHIEVPYFLNDLFSAHSSHTNDHSKKWEIQRVTSPVPQLEWENKWPEPNCMVSVAKAQKITEDSFPLGSMVSVKTVGLEKSNPEDKTFFETSKLNPTSYLWVTHQFLDGKNSLRVDLTRQAHSVHTGFLLHTPNAHWNSGLKYYLQSTAVTNWLDHQIEQKQGKWLLKDHHIKKIPVPKQFTDVFNAPFDLSGLGHEELESALKNLIFNPDALLELCTPSLPQNLKTHVYARVALVLADHEDCIKPYTNSIKSDGSFRWSQLLKLLPANDLVPWHLHPDVRVSGSLPSHIPVTRMDRVKAPFEGLLLLTEAGFSVGVQTTGSKSVQEMLYDQLLELSHPTWSELISTVKLPRNSELAMPTAREVLRCVNEQTILSQKLREILSTCMEFSNGLD